MTDDEVRDVFSPYRDRELDAEKSEAVRLALEANPALKKEYDSFCAMLEALGGMAEKSPPSTVSAVGGAPKVDLLRGVQSRLHKRSKGRFYADRWSRVAGVFPLEVLAALVLVGLVAAYFAMTAISVQPSGPTNEGGHDATTAPAR